MSGRYVMAIDAGTGSGRAIVYDLTGNIVGLAQEEWVHPQVDGVPGGLDFVTEANGLLLDRVIRMAISAAKVDADEISAVSTTSMREGFVLYDKAGCELWACPNIDSRAIVEADELVAQGAADRIFKLAGDWVSITAPARLLWIKRHHPEIYDKVHHFGMISDWIATRLSGVYATEPSAGSSSALFDLSTRDWSAELLSIVDLDRAVVPDVVESGTVIGAVTKAAAERCSLVAGTPVVTGGGDTQLALLGLGRRTGQATLVGGSLWQMTILSERPLIDPGFGPRTLCHARPSEWMTEGIGFLSGFALRWMRDAFFEPLRRTLGAEGNSFSMIETLATSVPPGAHGVIATTAKPMQSDAWVQPPLGMLGFDINRPEVALGSAVRAVMEASAFLVHDHLKTLERLSQLRYDTIQFTGGSSQSAAWSQIVSDVTGRPIDISVVKETTALGCAMLAASGAGLFGSLDEAVLAMASPIERSVEPSPDTHQTYREVEARWRGVTAGAFAMAENKLLEPLWHPAGARKG